MVEEIQKRLIEEEMKESYVDYAMSVIVGRALPDVKDGLKPVHRRVLFTMLEGGLVSGKPYKKSANILGNCMAKYHPHGDAAIYDTLVRLAQDFSMRYPLVDGQGNFGNIDGDNAAASRYTEARLTKIAEELLEDINKDTVDFVPNYDGSTEEPVVLPAKLPNLLINGASGIAVGMATSIPPHNLREVADGVLLTIDNPEVSVEELMGVIRGPDFPTGGIIAGRSGIKNMFVNGKGRLIVKAKVGIEEKKDKDLIVVKEIPYMVNKTNLIESIANLVNNKVIEGITDIRDESDRDGMRIVMELKKGTNSGVVLNQLFKHTQMQTTFWVSMLALHDSQPEVMSIKKVIEYYLQHRKEVITRKTSFELKKAEERAHIVEGLKTALAAIDAVVKLIKASKSGEEAKASLIKHYSLSELQAQAILDMKLQRLTSLEQNKLNEEHKGLVSLIAELKDILSSEKRIFSIIKKDVTELKEKYGDERKTEIGEEEEDMETEDLIPKEDVLVMATKSGYIKKMSVDEYQQQRRGGRGVIGTETKEDDVVEHLFTASTHSHLLFFSNKGKVRWLKTYQIPTASRYAKGKALINLMPIEEGERINNIIPIKSFDDKHFLIMVTKKGMAKKTPLMAFSKPRKAGIIAINLKEGDELVQVRLTPGKLRFIIGTKKGLALKFDEKNVRPMGRNSTGVRGIRLGKGDEVVGIEVALEIATLFTVTENGYGKRTTISDYRLVHRGGKGVINIKTNERNGSVVGIKTVMEKDELILTTTKGVVIRIPVEGVSSIGRNTQGVRIMKLDSGDKVATAARVINYAAEKKEN
ncbi:DNA gyrase subunit A [Candidatus Woesearchaeota archaeon]|nr:DNA gyrase subunit A [Candidatus Woesearchaeota archaeon]